MCIRDSASSKSPPSRTVQRISLCRSDCNFLNVSMAKGSSRPIAGYLCSTIVPSKSTAIIISLILNFQFSIIKGPDHRTAGVVYVKAGSAYRPKPRGLLAARDGHCHPGDPTVSFLPLSNSRLTGAIPPPRRRAIHGSPPRETRGRSIACNPTRLFSRYACEYMSGASDP